MPTYITLVNMTDQGVRNVKDTTKRAETFRSMAEKAGVRVKDLYWTMGRYDLVVVTEAASDELLSSVMLAVGSLGNSRTETLRAFSGTEMDRVIAAMP